MSQEISFSPDAGFKNVGTVVVTAAMGAVEVLRTVVGVVVGTKLEEPLQATSPIRKGSSSSAFFTNSFCRAIQRIHVLVGVLVVQTRDDPCDQYFFAALWWRGGVDHD